MKSLTLGLLVVLLTGPSAAAHHSFAAFDLGREITLVGTIKEVQFTNPHVWIQMLVPDGSLTRAEAPTPSRGSAAGCR